MHSTNDITISKLMIVQRVHAAGHSTAVGCLSFPKKERKKALFFCAKESGFLHSNLNQTLLTTVRQNGFK